jgi:hypothetical protein
VKEFFYGFVVKATTWVERKKAGRTAAVTGRIGQAPGSAMRFAYCA